MMAEGHTRPSRLALALLAATMLTPLTSAQAAPGDPLGTEFQINSFTTGDQEFPAVAMDADGDFVVVWQSDGQDGSYGGIYAQRYNAAGEAAGGEFRVNTTTENEQVFPAVAMDADGDFVVTWIGVVTDTPRIFAQRYDAAGVAQGGEFQVGGLDPAPGSPAVAMNDLGDFVVAWTAATGVGVYDILAQRFDAAGVAQGGAFLVSASAADLHAEPAVAMDADGDFVVAWEREIPSYPSFDRDILARRYNAAGVAQGDEFRVNTVTTEMQVNTAVAMDAEGDFVVTWEEWGAYGYTGYGGIFARRYDAAGVAQGDEVRVNTSTLDDSMNPAVAMDADGDFVVAWMHLEPYVGGWGIEARRYSAVGVPLGGEFLVSAETVSSGFPAVAMESDGDFAIAWAGADGDGSGISGQRFEGGGGTAVVSDFTADAMADILWRNSSTGSTIIWQMTGFVKDAAATIGTVSGAWKVEDIGDFTADGMADILWRNSSSGSTIIWQMNGLLKQAAAQIGTIPSGWKVKGVGDFDGDGKADILWRNSSSGQTIIWLMDGLTKASAASIGAPPVVWKIEGADDFNGDGRSDILWRNSSTGATIIWQMDGFTKVAAASIGAVSGGWKIEATGDFDGDGHADILWRNTSSYSTIIWQINGFTKVAAQSIGAVPTTWQVTRVTDYNGGGQADILWRHPSTGSTIIWQMNGFSKVAAQSIGSIPGVWEVE